MLPYPSPNHEPRPAGWTPTLLVIHYTATWTANSPRSWLCNPSSQVSAHYLIDRDGTVDALVDPADAAWHAGASHWLEHRSVRGSLNATSLSYELVNPNNGKTLATAPQIDALARLLARDALTYGIPLDRQHVVGHYEIAPGRKTDPDTLNLDRLVTLARGYANAEYTVIRSTSVREAPADDAPVAWGGLCILPVGQVLTIGPSASPDWLHWPSGGFVARADVVPGSPPIDARLPVLGTDAAFTPAQAIAYLTTRLAHGYVARDISETIIPGYADVCRQSGVRFDVAVAQMAHETGALSSFWSQRPQRNPAGIGVTGQQQATEPPDRTGWAYNPDRGQWEAGLSFPSWDVAIPAHVYRLLGYAATDATLSPTQRAGIAGATRGRPLPSAARGSAPQIVHLGAQHNLANVGLVRAQWRAGWAWPGTEYGARLATIIQTIRNMEGR
ncbi:MAG: N-acetylmuramoyl-L-alanine amidase [Chloroflexales bacterium]